MCHYHHYQDLRITDIAKTLHTSVRELQILFHGELHCTFHDYLREMRILHAHKIQSEHPWITIDELCDKVGFASKNGYYFALHKHQQKLINYSPDSL